MSVPPLNLSRERTETAERTVWCTLQRRPDTVYLGPEKGRRRTKTSLISFGWNGRKPYTACLPACLPAWTARWLAASLCICVHMRVPTSFVQTDRQTDRQDSGRKTRHRGAPPLLTASTHPPSVCVCVPVLYGV